jgi:hypothetical protein
MVAEVITFHKMLSGCVRGEHRFWEFFVSTYGSLAEHLVKQHFHNVSSRLPAISSELFNSTSENDRAFFREFSGSNERDFLIYFEQRVFGVTRRHSSGQESPSEFDFETLERLFGKVPLAYQEVAWLAMNGYQEDPTNRILRVPLALVQKAEEEVLKNWSEILSRQMTAFPLVQDHLRQQVESRKGVNCPAIKVFSDLMDGRIVWREKQQVENHIAECLYCLDRETSLKETLFHIRLLEPLPTESVQGYLRQLNIHEGVPARPSLLTKVFRVFK